MTKVSIYEIVLFACGCSSVVERPLCMRKRSPTIYDAILFFTIPYCTIIFFSTLSFHKLFKNSRLNNQNDHSKNEVLTENLDCLDGVQRVNSKRHMLPTKFSRPNSRRKMTLLLFVLPNFYLLMNLPVFIVILMEIYVVSSDDDASSIQALDGYDMAFHLSRSLMYTNSCLNVLFFILNGDYFKLEFLRF